MKHETPVAASRAARSTTRARAPALARVDHLSFALAGVRYTIEAKYVMQVLELGELTPLPGAPESLIGLTILHGEVLPVFDLRLVLGHARLSSNEMSQLIVLGVSSPELGILADTTDEILAFEANDLLARPGSFARGAACVRGVTRDSLMVLDGAALLRDPRLFVADAAELLRDEDGRRAK